MGDASESCDCNSWNHFVTDDSESFANRKLTDQEDEAEEEGQAEAETRLPTGSKSHDVTDEEAESGGTEHQSPLELEPRGRHCCQGAEFLWKNWKLRF